MNSEQDSPWHLAELAMAAFAAAPHALGGVWLRSAPGPVRDILLDVLTDFLGGNSPRRVPLHTQESRLLGGIDLAQTLAAGSLRWETGILEQSHGKVLVLAMAERADRRLVAHLCSALDRGELQLAREGLSRQIACEIGVLALDEGLADESPNPALTERLGLRIDLDGIDIHSVEPAAVDSSDILAAGQRWQDVQHTKEQLESLASVALSLGILSPRAVLLASRVARVLGALAGREETNEQDLRHAVLLSLSHRATQIPQIAEEDTSGEEDAQSAEPPEQPESPDADNPEPGSEVPLDSHVEAALAHLPPGLLESLRTGKAHRAKAGGGGGKSGAQQRHQSRGRPIGSGPGDPRHGQRLNLLATLRAAAPWQGLRKEPDTPLTSLQIRKSDFRVTRFRHRRESTALFVVDASGSTAMHRMGEAKGAVELLLADCYSRRDSVALIAFRGQQAELLLPPTRSLTRAKKALAALPGGGGTPLAHALDLTSQLTAQIQRDGATPTVVFLTDGVANIARDGSPGRGRAGEEALAAAASFQSLNSRSLLIDSSPRAQQRARDLAEALGSAYLVMPQADARRIQQAVQPAMATN